MDSSLRRHTAGDDDAADVQQRFRAAFASHPEGIRHQLLPDGIVHGDVRADGTDFERAGRHGGQALWGKESSGTGTGGCCAGIVSVEHGSNLRRGPWQPCRMAGRLSLCLHLCHDRHCSDVPAFAPEPIHGDTRRHAGARIGRGSAIRQCRRPGADSGILSLRRLVHPHPILAAHSKRREYGCWRRSWECAAPAASARPFLCLPR